MQRIDKELGAQELQEFRMSTLEAWLDQPSTDRVEVFKPTPREIEKRERKSGRKFKVSKGFKKAPSV